jgi:hypothetical protein
MNIERLYKRLKELDELATVNQRFDEMRAEGGEVGVTWAMERYAEQVFQARAMARIVRPLIELREGKTDPEWLAIVRDVRSDIIRSLINGHWRSNSTSMLQNAINQWEANAMARFVDMLRYAGLE